MLQRPEVLVVDGLHILLQMRILAIDGSVQERHHRFRISLRELPHRLAEGILRLVDGRNVHFRGRMRAHIVAQHREVEQNVRPRDLHPEVFTFGFGHGMFLRHGAHALISVANVVAKAGQQVVALQFNRV